MAKCLLELLKNKMEYKIIFTSGYGEIDDYESLAKGLKCDVLILDEKGDYYCPQFITIERINNEFTKNEKCYLEDNMVIMHEITKQTIMDSIPLLHKWLFFKHWIPVSIEILEEYFYPKDTWVIFPVTIND